MSADLDLFCNRLLSALLNGGYQGLILTGVIWIGLKIVPRANAATRHLVWMVTLVLVAALPAGHLLLSALAGVEVPALETFVGKNPLLASEDPALRAEPDLGSENLERTFDLERGPTLLHVPDFDFRKGTLFFDGFQSSGPENGSNAGSPIPMARDSEKVFALPPFLNLSRWTWQLSLPYRIGVAVIGAWLLLAAIRLGMLARQFGRLRTLKSSGTAVPEWLRGRFETLREELRMRRSARLMISHGCSTPMAVGFRRPVVLLPAKLCEGAAAIPLEQVLRHELAHFSRADDWANLTQQIIKAVLFFHPAIWWLSRRLTVEREIACDDHVLEATRAPRAYALFLTEFAGQMQGRTMAAALSAWSNKHQLEERITMILDSNRNTSPRLSRVRAVVLTAAAALVAILALRAGPRLAFAADQATANSAESVVTASTVADPPAPPSAADESGPRPKPQPAPLRAVTPVPPQAPHTAELPPLNATPAVLSVPAAPSLPVASVDAPAHPAPAAQPRARRSGGSVEQRLERLERLVEELLAREKGPKKLKDGEHGLNLNLNIPKIEVPKIEIPKLDLDAEKFARLAEQHKKLAEKMHKFGPNEEELARIKEQAAKSAEHAAREIERAAKDLEREKMARNRIEEHRAEHVDERSAARRDLQQQRRALETQRKSLEKQMQALERQIERLEEQQQKSEEESAAREKGPRPKKQDPKREPSGQEDSGGKEKPKARE